MNSGSDEDVERARQIFKMMKVAANDQVRAELDELLLSVSLTEIIEALDIIKTCYNGGNPRTKMLMLAAQLMISDRIEALGPEFRARSQR